MSRTEIERLALMQRIEERGTSQRMVAEQLGLSLRQVERLYRAYKALGAAGLVSGKRGQRSNRLVPEQLREAALKLIRSRYADFGPTLAHEKLVELHGFTVSAQTLRNWMIADGAWSTRRDRAQARAAATVSQSLPR